MNLPGMPHLRRGCADIREIPQLEDARHTAARPTAHLPRSAARGPGQQHQRHPAGLHQRAGVHRVLVGERLAVDGAGRLGGLREPTSELENRHVVEQLLAGSDRQLSVRYPLVQARVLDGTARLTAAIPPVAEQLSATLRRYTVRRGSGGRGARPGGDGIERVYEFRDTATVSLITERRHSAPPGLAGGEPGAVGRQWIERAAGVGREPLPDKVTVEVFVGDRVGIETPGGGGFGEALA